MPHTQFHFFGQDLTGLAGTVFNARFSLIGDNSNSGLAEAPVGAPDTNGNLIGGPVNGKIDPLFGPLIDNGGPTWTHAIGIGSPAIDAGDPNAVAGIGGVPEFDQRGAPSTRVAGGRIDMGAFELQPTAPELPGDYNLDGTVDTSDYVMWRSALGSSIAPYSGADGNGNGVVDQPDCDVWRAHFGMTLPPLDAGRGAAAAAALAEPVTQLAIVASQPSALPGGSAAAAPAVNLAPSNSVARGRSKRAAIAVRAGLAPPADAVFTMFGQRTSARPMAAVVRTALRNTTVDAAHSDSAAAVTPQACRSDARGRLDSSRGPAMGRIPTPGASGRATWMRIGEPSCAGLQPRTEHGLTNNRSMKRPVRLTAKQAPHRPGISRGARFCAHGR